MSPTDTKSPKHAAKSAKSGKSKKKTKSPKVQTVSDSGLLPPPPQPKPIASEQPGSGLSADQRDLVEKLSANLARAALTAQGASLSQPCVRLNAPPL